MEEKTLLKISLGAIIIGLTALFFYTEKVELESDLDLESVPFDKEVKIRGKITSLKTHEQAIFLEIAGERIETTKVVLFNDRDVFLKEGDYVELSGKVEEYKGKREVIADKVILK